MQHRILILLVLIFVTVGNSLPAQQIDRVEPPFWWRGMNDPSLQLMIHGSDISSTEVNVIGDIATLVATHRLTSSNYIFVDLLVADGTEAGEVEIEFLKNGEIVATYSYEFRKRRPGSADRVGFNSEDVMYLITPDRFANGDVSNDVVDGMREGSDRDADFGRHGGDLAGISRSLEYISGLGFTAIWLNPILENDQPRASYHGYSTTDFYKVDPRYGSNEDYVRLNTRAKQMGLKMIMDVIVNHCGSGHWWMEDPPSQDWINYYGEEYVQTNHIKATMLDPYGAPGDREKMIKGWFVRSMPDLNQDNPFMATYLIQNSIWWIEFADLDGLRQDTYSYPYRDFMSDWSCAIMNEYPSFNIVGEEWVRDPNIISYWQRDKHNPDGYRSCLPSLMDFPMTMVLPEALNEEDSQGTGWMKLYESLTRDYLYPHPEDLVIFPDNHDMSRILTQVNEDVALDKLAIAYILTMRGTPQIYYGTEILMSNQGTNSHGVIRSDFPGGWPGDSVNAFTDQGLSSEAIAMKQYVKTLLDWRKTSQVIHYGDLMHFIPENGIYVYFRAYEGEQVMVILNKSAENTSLSLNRFAIRLKGFSTGTDVISAARYDLGDSLIVPAKRALVLELE